ncbi:unnamed protein product [Darwinula stevensoni]|uniref:non-specific serine/threonine protein kinase n=1 Tax=Darwinula stevensoni TaxID=69355 RepID=A0A7R8X7Z3_9CRUS|nr:unnamed protein product [Darwinula stevensoni]CAG0883853.1 unnamed protein product [Darwinula stevensoni]
METAEKLDFSGLQDPGERFQVSNVISEGVFGLVYEAIDSDGGNRKVAIKTARDFEDRLQELDEEFRSLRTLHGHPSFPQFYGAFLKGREIWFVMELCPGRAAIDLVTGLLEKEKRMMEDHIAFIIRETVQAADYMHKRHILHRDIKGGNIVLTAQGDVKLVDFGSSAFMGQTLSKRKTMIGTPHWMAPEVIQCIQEPDMEYDIRADVWSIGKPIQPDSPPPPPKHLKFTLKYEKLSFPSGITAIELGDGKPPLWDVHPVRALLQIVRYPPPTLAHPIEWSDDYNDFVAECLTKNAECRPIMEELTEHPFLKQIPDDDFHLRKELKMLCEDLYPDKLPLLHRPLDMAVKNGYLKKDMRSDAERLIPDDLVAVERMTKEMVLEILKLRYQAHQDYTFVGDMLLAMEREEPEEAYDPQLAQNYVGKTRSDNQPHIFAMADRAWQDMLHHKKSQILIFRGESGSGKTKNVNQLVHHLCHLGEGYQLLATKLVQANFILEAFTSATTSKNIGSATRCFRFLELSFTKAGRVSGFRNRIFMLDRRRLVRVPRGESNFLILYYFYEGLKSQGDLKTYGLSAKGTYRILPKFSGHDSGKSSEQYQSLISAFKILELSEGEVDSVFKILAAILETSELQFTADSQGIKIRNEDTARNAAKLLELEEEEFMKALTKQSQPEEARDEICQMLFQRLIDWLVHVLNTSFTVSKFIYGDEYSIGILDVNGFENNEENSLHQLFVNVANEVLQHHYHQQIFVYEMHDLELEGIKTQALTFNDNRSVIDLLMNKVDGILQIIDDHSNEAISIDSFLGDVSSLEKESIRVNTADMTLTIEHRFGPVNYNLRHLLQDNRCTLSNDLAKVLKLSGNALLSSMASASFYRTGSMHIEEAAITKHKGKGPRVEVRASGNRSKHFPTRSKHRYLQNQLTTWVSAFRHSLLSILEKLINSHPHHALCLKIENGRAKSVENHLSHQLDDFSVVETISIRKQGFPCRIHFEEFLRRYQFLAFDFDESVACTMDNCRLLLLRLQLEGYSLSRMGICDRLYEREVRKIVKIQAMVRRFLARRQQKQQQKKKRVKRFGVRDLGDDEAAVRVQRLYRGYLARKRNPKGAQLEVGENEDKMTSTIHHYWRKWRARTIFQQLQRYRAAKMEQLIYFSQQVHLYGQEVNNELRRWNAGVDLSQVEEDDPETPKHVLKEPKLTPLSNIPLRLTDLGFYDAFHMCDPNYQSTPAAKQVTNEQEVDDKEEWDNPLKCFRLLPRDPATLHVIKDIGRRPDPRMRRKREEGIKKEDFLPPPPQPEEFSPSTCTSTIPPPPATPPSQDIHAVKAPVTRRERSPGETGNRGQNFGLQGRCLIDMRKKLRKVHTTDQPKPASQGHQSPSSPSFDFQALLRKTEYRMCLVGVVKKSASLEDHVQVDSPSEDSSREPLDEHTTFEAGSDDDTESETESKENEDDRGVPLGIPNLVVERPNNGDDSFSPLEYIQFHGDEVEL